MKEIKLDDIDGSAISVRGLCKRYGSHNVLNNLCMTVPQGCIYGLLGSSGCGKTTLLNCIMGNTHFNGGEIQMKGRKASDIGYMPQDVALIPTLSILEMFYYYGTMFGMSKSKIKDRANELSSLLQLPPLDSWNGCLSGGEQRRVSFAVALLHDPQVLILDEPTVGLDPLLSQSIWAYLLKLTTDSNKTIILTTHYIEEARHAHMVGLMRGGRLLAETSPSELMSTHNCSSLEETFLLLSQADEQSQTSIEVLKSDASFKFRSPLIKKKSFSFNRFRAQLNKNYTTIIRDIPLFLILFALPVLQCTFQGLAVGHDPSELPIAVVNHDTNNCTGIHSGKCDWSLSLSCRFLEYLNKTTTSVHVEEKSNLLEAEEDLKRNNVWGVIYFSPNFSSSLSGRFLDAIILDVNDNVLEMGAIDVRLDMSNQIIGNLLRKELADSLINFIKMLYRECDLSDSLAGLPIRIEDPIYGTRKPVFTHFQTPAVVIAFNFYLPLLFTSAIVLSEKVSGVLERTISIGLTPLEMVLAHTGIQFVITNVQVTMMHIVYFVIFDNPFVCSIWPPFILSLMQAMSGMCLGFLVSAFSNSHIMAMMSGTGVFFFVTFTSGLLWPLEGIPYSFRTLMLWTPLALPTEAMRGLTTRGWPITHPQIYIGFLSVSIWGIIFVIGTFLVIHYKGFHIRK